MAGSVRGLALLAAIPFAFGSAVSKGVLFSTTSQPGWKDARWPGGYLTNSAIAIGAAGWLAIATVLGQDAAAAALRPTTRALLVINLVFAGLLHGELAPAMRRVGGGERLQRSFVLRAGVGGLVPAALVPAGGGLVLVSIVLAPVVLGFFLERRAIVMLPHHPMHARSAS